MKRIVSKVGLGCLIMASLFVLASCSSSKKTTTRKGDASVAANAIDYKQIKKEIDSKSSEFYYPELLRRFEAADTTMTIEHLRHIYYGAATLPDYNPYASGFESELEKALAVTEPTQSDWENALDIVNKHLSKDPANLTSRLYKLFISENIYGEDSQEFIKAYNQLTMLFYAILSTGDGQSKETAFYITSVSDEYTFMKMIGVRPQGQALVGSDNGESFDVMDIVDDDGSEGKLYFNITIMMKSMNKLFN